MIEIETRMDGYHHLFRDAFDIFSQKDSDHNKPKSVAF